ncbi:hypothetical protein ABZY09_44475 [Streptomyces sp. NPDC002928]|uniref:hypothetical protein n=1 Tax=Streptomyces sp. NPDC002928 TaxID=3154440 RepID=UPI0033A53217
MARLHLQALVDVIPQLDVREVGPVSWLIRQGEDSAVMMAGFMDAARAAGVSERMVS